LPVPALAACYRNAALEEAAKQAAEFGQQRSLPPSWCGGGVVYRDRAPGAG